VAYLSNKIKNVCHLFISLSDAQSNIKFHIQKGVKNLDFSILYFEVPLQGPAENCFPLAVYLKKKIFT
jgi:hypothetical protein